MKALSIRQPWAWLIVNGHKDVENRTWPTRFRGRVLIHANKNMTQAEFADAAQFIAMISPIDPLPLADMANADRGGIVGVATITDCVPASRRASPWHIEGAFGFQIIDARPLPFIECKGALGFFDVSPDVAAKLRAMHGAPAKNGGW
jgi:hypothetical protein